ncbi:tRNA (adenosine(37)-N6)-threonylcarbamoyltransferase complex dimerization subunit type 1 TsaB [Pilimelia terevasa]|uniref:tRNA (Adenosine(37)-N6)-threonylcarbamoyltransferase complex dimerization subunit type 1 TsaB n=1 Tax=Pilimelia terevasa TaxID=53372 RepID=A0A8J3BJT0_9ACTN|nr:tRNA (adenosine(37)-N6)-threonylcarbamoyltransferase complex dimerization subunit type 1 TsaB [Pilimelia terevasa]GGK14079.1 tRNA (adenosine(37)-N6)-threonylcarbamoyltransferase complex dimerization subunit type 1 TsaB [Pilimelia terevasa]
MFALVLDSGTPAVTAGIVRVAAAGVEVCAARVTVDARAHGELLAPHVAAALAEAGVARGDLAAVVAGVGPGPYTSLRVGLVTAAAFAQALGLPTYGVGTLDALGHAAAGLGRVLAATDARRREIYWAAYADGRPLTPPAVAAPAAAEVRDAVAAHGVAVAVGEGAARYAEVLGLPAAEPTYPAVASLAALAADRIRAGAPGEALTPRYLRRPDAVAAAARKPVRR